MKKQFLCALAFSVVCLSGCGGGDGGSGGGGGNPIPPPDPPNPIESFRINFGAFSNPEVADVLFVNAPPTGEETLTVALDNDNRGGVASEEAQARADEEEAMGCRDLPPHLQEEECQAVERAIQARASGVTADTIRPRFEEIPVGGDYTFFVVGSGNVLTRKVLPESATVHCTIFAEVRNGQPILSEARALALAEAWDSSNPQRPGSGIYTQVRSLFGSEWTANGGRDGDSKVVLVFCGDQTLGSSLFGFFRPSDEFSSAEVPTSNEGEILYLNADNPDFDVLATMVHEFQHMVRYNEKLIQQGSFAGEAENDTIDEGCSMVAEEITGYGLEAQGGGNSFIFNAVQSYLTQAETFNLFGSFNGSLKFYGGGYLLCKYFREHVGDATFRQFNTNTAIGFQNMVNVSGQSSQNLFRRFSLALLASPFSGAVPSEARFPVTGFTTEDTYDIRGQGLVTLPGLEPAQVLNPPSNPTNVTVLPFAPTLVRMQGGSGNELVVQGTVNGPVTIEGVLETMPGEVAFTQVVTSEQTTARQEFGEDTSNRQGYTNPVTPGALPERVGGVFPAGPFPAPGF